MSSVATSTLFICNEKNREKKIIETHNQKQVVKSINKLLKTKKNEFDQQLKPKWFSLNKKSTKTNENGK